MTDEQVHAMLVRPLRELTSVEIQPYAESVLLTVGTEADYMYYLPRIWEVSLEEWARWYPNPPVVFGRLRKVDWRSWDRAKVSAIDDLLQAIFERNVVNAEDGRMVDSWLCALACCVSDEVFVGMLSELDRSPGPLLHLRAHTDPKSRGVRLGAFWDDVPERRDLVRDLMTSGRALALLQSGFQGCSDFPA